MRSDRVSDWGLYLTGIDSGEGEVNERGNFYVLLEAQVFIADLERTKR